MKFDQLFSSEDTTVQGEGVLVLKCPHCREAHAVFFKPREKLPIVPGGGTRLIATDSSLDRTGQWPPAGVVPPHAAIPHQIAEDWTEAHKAVGVGLWKSAVTMARRAVQGVCIEKGASAGTLYEQLKALSTSQTLHPHLVEWSNKIRAFGNVGAHPGKDGLDQVDEQQAVEIVAFLDQLLLYVYELPDRLSKLSP